MALAGGLAILDQLPPSGKRHRSKLVSLSELSCQVRSTRLEEIAVAVKLVGAAGLGYYIYRNDVSVGSTTSTTYSDINLSPSTQYKYYVKAFDQAGNISDPSNTIYVTTQSAVDNPPVVSITNPADGNTVTGTITVTATATDDKGVTKVDFYIDNVFKYSDTTSPYSWPWDTTAYSYGSHSVRARAYDTINQYSDDTHNVSVDNQQQPTLTISNVSESATASSGTISWTTNIPATSQIRYGTSPAYGSQTPFDSSLVTSHSITIIGLNRNTWYYYEIVSTADGQTTTYSDRFKTKNR